MSDSMKILHYNILDGFRQDERRIDVFSAYLKESGFDVISLNEYRMEVGCLDSRLADLGYNYSAVNLSAPSKNRCAIFSRAAFTKIKNDGDFRFLHVKFGDLDFFNYHASPDGVAPVLREMKKLAPLLEGKSDVIVAGDFNSLSPLDREKFSYDRPLAQMRSRYVEDQKVSYQMIEALVEQGFVDLDGGGDPGNNTVPTKIPRLKEPGFSARLDYAFGRLNSFVASSKVIKNTRFDLLSDHYPVEILITPAG